MFVSGKHLLACAILLTLGHSISAEYDVAAYCSLVKIGQKLPSTENCRTYYICGRSNTNKNNQPTYLIAQCDAGQKFDVDSQSCRNAASVNCFIGEQPTCVGLHEEHIPVMNTCNQYIWCKNGKEVGYGECPKGTYFAKKDGQGTCENGNCADHMNTVTSGQAFTSVCSIMPPNVYFGSTTTCDVYQWCTSKGLQQGSCLPKYGAFVTETGNCGYIGNPDANVCGRVTGVDIQPDGEREKPCLATEIGQIQSSASKCSRFLRCNGKIWEMQSCGTGNYFDIVKNGCTKRALAQPNPKCNRCEFFQLKQEYYWANVVDPTCESYVRCENGAQVGNKRSCGDGKYFSESAQSCINALSSPTAEQAFIKYVENNGACAAGGGVDCTATCKAITDPTKCVVTSGCKCDFNAGKCADCSIESNCNFCKKSTDITTCVEPSELSCYVKDNQCVYCGVGQTAVGTTCEDDDIQPPEDICECAKITDLTKCIVEGNCECGLNSGKCADCADAADCNLCKKTTDLVNCAKETNDTCFVNEDEECEYCEEGEIAEADACIPDPDA